MAVVFDNVASVNGAANLPTVSITIGSGTNRILFAGLSYSGNTTISGVTASSAMTKLTSLTEGSGATSRSVDIWYLLNPASGSTTITPAGSSTSTFVLAGISFSGVSQSVPLGTAVTNGGTLTNSLSATTTGSTSSDIILAVMVARDSGAVTIGGSQTSKWALFASTNIAGTGTIQTGGASITSTFSWATADNGAMIAVPILNDGGGATVVASPTHMMMGMGS